MSFAIVSMTPPPRRSILARLRRKPRLTLRQLAVLIESLREAECRHLHANRDQCVGCKIASSVQHHLGMRILPARYAKDSYWMHRHVEMPAARRFARAMDEEAAE